MENAQALIQEKIDNGDLIVPQGISYKFTGTYENQLRAEKTLSIVVPLCLIIIFLILYFQFKSVTTSLMVFTAIAVAFAGGFVMIWLYGQEWFLNFSLFGENLRELFNIKTVNLSVAVWVGFIALFGIATDDGVVMATYLNQSFDKEKPSDKPGIRQATRDAAGKRIRPCLMTTVTTVLALLPVLTSTGKGSDIMIPMAIPIMVVCLSISRHTSCCLFYTAGEKNINLNVQANEKSKNHHRIVACFRFRESARIAILHTGSREEQSTDSGL
ncbi:cobalt-zinc-cadmium resistance protein CzcA [Nonlabens tegetincola]|uniref:Cobalt-zinc-cadmium resistance protein CzcA n=1 Tax=Nonlabens tegetincola TaxID=323273 RepID=A0A090Q0R5_9FLAO|nr:cobalt-zinc-cadmium resistance protein CzcA [Nonlabens tegetincola]